MFVYVCRLSIHNNIICLRGAVIRKGVWCIKPSGYKLYDINRDIKYLMIISGNLHLIYKIVRL